MYISHQFKTLKRKFRISTMPISHAKDIKILEDKVLGSPIVHEELPVLTEETLAGMEENILSLASKYCSEAKDQEMIQLVYKTRPFLKLLSKSKAAKLLRQLVDKFLSIDPKALAEKAVEGDVLGEEGVELLRSCIDWSESEKRSYMRQSLQVRLVALLSRRKRHGEAVELAQRLAKELKKVDDKSLQVEVELWMSRSYMALGNADKARNSLLCARGTAHAIYVSPETQAELDLQAGILAARGGARSKGAGGRDSFKTAHGYFFEAFEQFDAIGGKERATLALKYIMLSQLIQDRPDEVLKLVKHGQVGLKYLGRDMEAMRALALASKHDSLADFNQALNEFKVELEGDDIVKDNIKSLFDRMVEQNLCSLVRPYSVVQVAHLADKIGHPVEEVERKLCTMILDKKINGILDHRGDVQVFVAHKDQEATDTENAAIDTFKSLAHTMDHLTRRAARIV